MNDIKEKTCRKCGHLKAAEDFYENKYSPDGLYAFCKVCFDQFAEKLKDKKSPPADLNKACEKCGKIRHIEAFKSDADTPDFKKNWCRKCRRQYDILKKKKAENAKQVPPLAKQAPKQRQPATPEKKKESIKPAAVKDPKPAKKTPPSTSDDFDYIEYLVENQALKKKLEREILQIPKQTTKITARKRICNGCQKTEEIDQVEKNTVIPVHAWFCDVCRQRSNKRWVRKGTITCDYWGREFKVKKIISNDLVLGVLKNKNGKWETKSFKIYGDWKTPKHNPEPGH